MIRIHKKPGKLRPLSRRNRIKDEDGRIAAGTCLVKPKCTHVVPLVIKACKATSSPPRGQGGIDPSVARA